MPDNKDKIVLSRERFPGNSDKDKPTVQKERPKVKKVATAKRVKKPLHKRFANAFLDGEPAHEVGNYVLYEVIIPAAKSTIADLIEGAIDMLLFGGAGRGRSRSPYVARDRGKTYVTPYNSMYDRNPHIPGSRGRSSRASAGESSRLRSNDVSDVVFPGRADAELVLAELAESIDKYEAVSLSDFYEMAGIPAPYTAQKWGWTNIDGCAVRAVRGGWVVELPSPVVIT